MAVSQEMLGAPEKSTTYTATLQSRRVKHLLATHGWSIDSTFEAQPHYKPTAHIQNSTNPK